MSFRWDEKEYGPHPPERDEFGLLDGRFALLRLKEIVLERRKVVQEIDDEPIARELRAEQEQERQRQDEDQAREASRKNEIDAISI